MRSVDFTAFGYEVKNLEAFFSGKLRMAHYEAALESEQIAVRCTPKNYGEAAMSWRVIRTYDGAILVNSAPHAAILEEGSRPHRPPIMPIFQWVKRVFDKDLKRAAVGQTRTRKIMKREYTYMPKSVSKARPFDPNNQRHHLHFASKNETQKKIDGYAMFLALKIRSKISVRGTPRFGMLANNMSTFKTIDEQKIEKHLSKDN